jgi:outer membrane biosynthesis protein TonB
MKTGFGLMAAAAAVLSLTAPAQADPLDFFKSLVPKRERFQYLPDGAYIMDEEDYYRYLRKKRMRRRAIQETYYEPELGADDDIIVDEPQRPKKKATKPSIKAVSKPVPAKKKAAPTVAAKPAPKAEPVIAAKPKTVTEPQPKAVAIAKPVDPPTASTTPTAGGMSCAKATQIVSGYGFDSVSPQACSGKVYAFNALRGGKSFVVRVDAASGELTEVKKVQ